jgi:hypothetical protein
MGSLGFDVAWPWLGIGLRCSPPLYFGHDQATEAIALSRTTRLSTKRSGRAIPASPNYA